MRIQSGSKKRKEARERDGEDAGEREGERGTQWEAGRDGEEGGREEWRGRTALLLANCFSSQLHA